jgi:hypothetical protein
MNAAGAGLRGRVLSLWFVSRKSSLAGGYGGHPLYRVDPEGLPERSNPNVVIAMSEATKQSTLSLELWIASRSL